MIIITWVWINFHNSEYTERRRSMKIPQLCGCRIETILYFTLIQHSRYLISFRSFIEAGLSLPPITDQIAAIHPTTEVRIFLIFTVTFALKYVIMDSPNIWSISSWTLAWTSGLAPIKWTAQFTAAAVVSCPWCQTSNIKHC